MDQTKAAFHPSNLVSMGGVPAVQTPEVLVGELIPSTADYTGLPIEKQEALKCKDRLEQGANNLSKTLYDMSLDLRLAHQMKYAAHWDMSFEEFAEKKLRLGFRTAYDLVNVGQFILDYGITREQAELSGQTKLREIARFVGALPEAADKRKEVDDLLMEAPHTPVLELKEKLKEKKDALVENKDPATFKYRMQSQVFKEDAAQRMADVVEAAKAELSLGDQETTPEVARKVTEHVFSEWLRLSGGSAQGSSLEDWMAFIERNYGVKLTQVVASDQLEAALTPSVEIDLDFGDEVDLNKVLSDPE